MTVPVGADIESLCSKCGDVWHVVVAKVGEKIVKVQCRQCGRQHRFKSPQPASRPAAAAPSGTPRSRKAAAAPPAAVEPDPSRPPQPYRPSGAFSVGDRVQHATFGLGVVEELPAPGKMQVRFAVGRKLLVHQRTIEPGAAH